jgi:hypothetical protein
VSLGAALVPLGYAPVGWRNSCVFGGDGGGRGAPGRMGGLPCWTSFRLSLANISGPRPNDLKDSRSLCPTNGARPVPRSLTVYIYQTLRRYDRKADAILASSALFCLKYRKLWGGQNPG